MKIMRAVSSIGVVCLAGGVLVGSPGARADDCDLASAAAIAQAKVPYAATHVTTLPGKPPIRAEMIVTDSTAYTQTNGTWHAMPFSTQQQIDMVNAARKRAAQTTHTCQKVGSEPINGEAASLWIMHTEANGKPIEERIWISDRTGLPLKSEAHLGSGTVLTDDFRYSNIEAPPGVK